MIRLFLLFPALLFAAYSGRIVDSTTQLPVAKAMISDRYQTVRSDANGTFTIDTNATSLNVKAYGYRLASISTGDDTNVHTLDAIDVKALYLSFWGASPNGKTLKRVLKLIDETEVNAIVVDVKNEFGLTSYKTNVAKANDHGVWYKRTIKDMESFMRLMKEKEIYMIARVVVFKDELQATNYPERALKLKNGEIWQNREKMAWVDPFVDESHDYTLAIAEDAAKVGFDEVNFDYIRFPAKADLLYAGEYTQENRTAAIERFLSSAQERLRPYGTFISVDTYGYVCWNSNDTNIGQTAVSLAKHADYLSPMLYPSGFDADTLGFKDPTRHSYEIVKRSIEQLHAVIDPVRVRPWLQAFKDYAHGRKQYREDRIAEQIQAAYDTNSSGWMLWNPSSSYRYVNNRLFEVHLPIDGIKLMNRDRPLLDEEDAKGVFEELIYDAG